MPDTRAKSYETVIKATTQQLQKRHGIWCGRVAVNATIKVAETLYTVERDTIRPMRSHHALTDRQRPSRQTAHRKKAPFAIHPSIHPTVQLDSKNQYTQSFTRRDRDGTSSRVDIVVERCRRPPGCSRDHLARPTFPIN